MEKIILIGAGGHAKVIVDTIERLGTYDIQGFIEPVLTNEEVYRGYRVIGTDDDLESIYKQGIKTAFVCIGYLGGASPRKQIYEKLQEYGYRIPAIIDETAVVAEDAKIGAGTYVGKRAVVNSNAEVGEMCIINTASVIEHDCVIGDFSHISIGTILCGMVTVGKSSFIGAGATVIQEKKIGDDSVVAAGAVVIENVPDNMMVKGVPGK